MSEKLPSGEKILIPECFELGACNKEIKNISNFTTKAISEIISNSKSSNFTTRKIDEIISDEK